MRPFVAEHIRSLPASRIRDFFDIATAMPNVISLGIGEPDFVTPPAILRAGINALKAGETHYTSNAGLPDFLSALSRHLEKLYGIRYDPAGELTATVGVSEALYLALNAVLDPGDEVLIPEPCFTAYTAEVMLAGGVPVTVPTYMQDDFQVRADLIDAAITPNTKALLISYPSNPTGAVMTRHNMRKVAEVAEKHDLLVISDELYDQLTYGFEHVCFPALPGMRERTILLGGMSKAYAMTGWRLGYAAAPLELSDAMCKIHQYTIMSAPTIPQVAGVVAFETDLGCEAVMEMRAEYDRRRRLIVDGLNGLGLACFEPRGAFYAFPNVGASGMDDETFAARLLKEAEVAVVPGSAFGPSGAGFVRCSYATAYHEIEEALERMETFMRHYG